MCDEVSEVITTELPRQ